MTEEKKEPFNIKTLKKVLEKEIEARSSKYCSDQAPATHQHGKKSRISRYINAQVIENMLERIISQLGGGSLEQGMVFVSVTDKNGGFVTSDSDSDKIIVTVAYGQELIIQNREYPTEKNASEVTEKPQISKQLTSKIPASEVPQPEPMPEMASNPVAISDGKPANKASLNNNNIKAIQLQLANELKRKLEELWINRVGLGVDFSNPGALKIELIQDSPRISKILQKTGGETLDLRIDREAGLVKVYAGGKLCLKWEFPEDKM